METVVTNSHFNVTFTLTMPVCFFFVILDSNVFLCYISPYKYTYLLTPWCRVLLEKLIGLQLLKKFPTFHGPRRFITAFTSIRHLSLSWARPIQSIYPHPTSWRSILILTTHLRLGLPSGLIPSGFPSKITYTLPYPHPYVPHAQPISFTVHTHTITALDSQIAVSYYASFTILPVVILRGT